ncbi:MAG: DUF190 domain-containing protein [Elusimicrobia bacterium]|nr:DUF190 domain-containing protein [Elusimicrobiota bacterium]MDE2426136.1 DUF190 domain-containing protein [Elusimicrobiota bacterium]
MRLEGEQKLVRIFIGEQDKWGRLPLYEAIVNEARSLGMAGATVVRGFLGFGCKAHVHTAKLLELSMDLPIIVEIVDAEDRVARLLPKLDQMVTEGLVTVETVHVHIYRANIGAPRSRNA